MPTSRPHHDGAWYNSRKDNKDSLFSLLEKDVDMPAIPPERDPPMVKFRSSTAVSFALAKSMDPNKAFPFSENDNANAGACPCHEDLTAVVTEKASRGISANPALPRSASKGGCPQTRECTTIASACKKACSKMSL